LVRGRLEPLETEQHAATQKPLRGLEHVSRVAGTRTFGGPAQAARHVEAPLDLGVDDTISETDGGNRGIFRGLQGNTPQVSAADV
jgi:hypothetical protein